MLEASRPQILSMTPFLASSGEVLVQDTWAYNYCHFGPTCDATRRATAVTVRKVHVGVIYRPLYYLSYLGPRMQSLKKISKCPRGWWSWHDTIRLRTMVGMCCRLEENQLEISSARQSQPMALSVNLATSWVSSTWPCRRGQAPLPVTQPSEEVHLLTKTKNW